MFVVYEVMPTDGKRFPRFESDWMYECEVWIYQHQYDIDIIRAGSKLEIDFA